MLAMSVEAQQGGTQLLDSLSAWETSTTIQLPQTQKEPATPPQGLLVPLSHGPVSAVSCAPAGVLQKVCISDEVVQSA